MKISKLFHWLYAVVMLLPIFAIGITCGYVVFNKNAFKSYGDSSIQQTTLVTNNSQLLVGSTYIVNYANKGTGYEYTPVFNYSWVSKNWTDYGIDSQYNYNGFRLAYDYIQLYVDGVYTSQNVNLSTLKEFSFTFESISQSLTNTGHSNMYLITTMEGKLTEVFYYSIDKVKESPIFSWASGSFVYEPFTYITDLFSVNNDNNFIAFIMSYWASISIIWLTFDVLMYVPLLVHRWLDKGVLE